MNSVESVPVVVGVVDGGIGINFGRRHGLENEEHKSFLHDLLEHAGFPFPQTVRYDRNKQSQDGKSYVDWMRLRIPSDECQVNGVNPSDAVVRLRKYLNSGEITARYGVTFEVGPDH